MPIKNDPAAIRNQIHHALRNDILSNREAKRLLRSIEKDGITDAEVDTVVDTLKSALAGGPDGVSLDTSTRARERNINRFLGRLHDKHGVDIGNVSTATPGASVNWLELMTMQGGAVVEPLAKPSYGGNEIAIDDEGGLAFNGDRLNLTAVPPSDESLEALWSLSRPGQLTELSESSRTQLQHDLLDVMETHNAVGKEEEHKYKRLVATNASAGALAETAEHWDSATVDRVINLANEAQTPLTKSLLLRGLEKAELTDTQKTAMNGIEKAEHGEELLAEYDKIRGEGARADYSNIKGETAEFALSALSFAKSKKAMDNVYEGMGVWKDLNNDYSQPWDKEELGHMKEVLSTYVDGYPQSVYQYGTFARKAPAKLANITSARVNEAVMPALEAHPPKLGNTPLTREQADFVKTLMPNVRDEKGVEQLERSLGQAAALFEDKLPSRWGTPETPDKPMAPAAFELFKEAASGYNDTAEASKDGKLGYNDFLDGFRDRVEELHNVVKPRMQALDGQPPRWGETELSPEAAQYTKNLLTDHTRSAMSVDNIGRAIKTIGDARGGQIEGETLREFQQIVTDYKANWSDRQTFDFNKLERIAGYKIQGKEVPLCTVNGQQVGLAEFYDKVGLDVSANVDRSRLRHNWMADRWGYRARQSVEVLDVVAEQTARGEGPVAELRRRFPGKEIMVQGTGRDGAHEQFVYVVKDGHRTMGSYNQGSDGTLSRFHGRTNPILYTATIGEEGELNVNVPEKISLHRFGLQTNYGVGDKIDIHWSDPNAEEAQEEGELFTTPSRVLEAEILSFDTRGNYKVKYTTPDGEEKTRTLTMRDIKRANNPHYFKAKSSYFSDVTINLQTDKELASFLDEAQPIIDRYLPADGSTITMSSAELAKRQKECIDALMDYTAERVKYPASKTSNPDEKSARYHELVDAPNRFPLGELVKIGKGVCRHQCILEHLLLQRAGIDSRLSSGAANTSSGNFRGYHIWTEVSLADDTRFLSDQTWSDVTIPLWDGAYDTDKRRTEMYRRTAHYDYALEE